VRVAVVSPRYGSDIVGGSEAAMRMIAERLHSQLGWRVQALTTCAADHTTWENALPAGESIVNGVRVCRFPSVQRRTREFQLLTDRLLAAPSQASLAVSERWIDLQGPRCPELVMALGDSDADVVVFSPYLYYPAVRGIEIVTRRSILHPAAHDEPEIYLPVFRDTFLAAAGLVFNGAWERRFVHRLFGVDSALELILGLGVEDPGDERAVPGEIENDAFGLGGRPYLCCVGRIEQGKGSFALAEMFAAYKREHPGSLRLVMVGPAYAAPPPHPDIVLTGQVNDALKWSLIDGSLGLVAPSPFESFGLALLEAWTRRRPVLVNARCQATREQAELSRGGLSYGSVEEFTEAVTRLAQDSELREELGQRGRAYVDRNYRWTQLIERWGRFAEQVADRAA
jgi:glycosyltransferase involved in cell wall biosynthesis